MAQFVEVLENNIDKGGRNTVDCKRGIHIFLPALPFLSCSCCARPAYTKKNTASSSMSGLLAVKKVYGKFTMSVVKVHAQMADRGKVDTQKGKLQRSM